MKIHNDSQAKEALVNIRAHQAAAKKAYSPLVKAAEAQEAANLAIEIVDFLLRERA